MAKFTEEERIEKTIGIANYIIENNASTRKVAEHFGISNATVSDWMNLVLIKLDGKKYLKVQDILTGNKPKTLQDDFVKQRVLDAAELIKQNFIYLLQIKVWKKFLNFAVFLPLIILV